MACLLVGVLFAGVAFTVRGCWPMAIPSVLFFVGAFATASAALTRSNKASAGDAGYSTNVQTNKPTFAIVVLLIGVYSWILTLAMHAFHAFPKNGPGSFKYYVTLGIAFSSTLFMRVYGRGLIRQHFGARGGRGLTLRSGQIAYVVIFVLVCSIYFVWLLT